MEQYGGKVPAYLLDDMQQQSGRTLREFATNGAVTPQEHVRYAPIKDAFVDAIDAGVPGYRNYLATYAADSVPINTMESVRRLADVNAPGGVNFAGDPLLTATRLKSVLRGDDAAEFPMAP